MLFRSSAGVVTLIRKAGNAGAHTLQLLFSWALFGILFSSISLIHTSWKWPSSTLSWLYVVAMSVVGSAAHFLLNYAGRLAPASLSSIVRSSDLMFAYIWEMTIFSQTPNAYTWMGVGLISLSLLVITLQKVQEYQNEQQATMKRHASDIITKSDDETDTVVTDNEDTDTFLDEQDLELQQQVVVAVEHDVKVYQSNALKASASGDTRNGARYTKVAASDDISS